MRVRVLIIDFSRGFISSVSKLDLDVLLSFSVLIYRMRSIRHVYTLMFLQSFSLISSVDGIIVCYFYESLD